MAPQPWTTKGSVTLEADLSTRDEWEALSTPVIRFHGSFRKEYSRS
jgi:hypothetical protein